MGRMKEKQQEKEYALDQADEIMHTIDNIQTYIFSNLFDFDILSSKKLKHIKIYMKHQKEPITIKKNEIDIIDGTSIQAIQNEPQQIIRIHQDTDKNKIPTIKKRLIIPFLNILYVEYYYVE